MKPGEKMKDKHDVLEGYQQVQFTGSYSPYNVGEYAAFTPEELALIPVRAYVLVSRGGKISQPEPKAPQVAKPKKGNK